jgi:hypothetical protein
LPNTQEILGQSPEGVRRPSLLSKLAWQPTIAWSIALSFFFCFAILMIDANAQFLYFQF